MNLLIDAGNTNLKWALSDSQALQYGQVITLKQSSASLIQSLQKAWHGLKPERVVVSHVGHSEFVNLLNGWCLKNWNLTPLYLRSQKSALGVNNAYENPAQLGIDRWLSLVAAHHLRLKHKTLAIIDCGTCITLDVLTLGQHLGGAIFPGMQLMADSVSQVVWNSSKKVEPLSLLSEKCTFSSKSLLQKNTEQAVLTGAVYSYVSIIEKITSEVPLECASEPCFILTGGGLELIRSKLKFEHILMPHLVLQGIHIVSTQDQEDLTPSRINEADEMIIS